MIHCVVHVCLMVCVLYTLIYAGVYLSLGGRIIPPDSAIFITDIRISSPNQLVCKSDRKSCCHDQPQYGGWYFPNRSQILTFLSKHLGFIVTGTTMAVSTCIVHHLMFCLQLGNSVVRLWMLQISITLYVLISVTV